MSVFYVTTPIYYPNAPPHIGHAYTTVFADVLARFHRLTGGKVFFLTGNDEHGLKIQRVAEKAGKHPKEYVDEMANLYREYWRILNISYDYFIRTTDPYHEKAVKEAFNYIYGKGLIYKAKYSGMYCVDCEKYYSPGEYTEVEGKPYCPIHNKPLEYLEEETYYFKLSEFKDYLLDVLENQDIVYPSQYAREVASKIRNEGLRDVSVARPVERVWWGIPVPFDDKYVIYVWFDALMNYLSGIGYPDDKEKNTLYWSNVHHIIGKDILWFHTAVWFSMLKALDMPPPRRVIVHSYLISKGLKISKSIGNVISIEELVERYNGSDGVRYLLSRIFNTDKDSEVSFELLDSIYNTELADTFGNLVRRVGSLALKKMGGKVYKRSIDENVADVISSGIGAYLDAMRSYEVSKALEHVMNIARYANQYINETKPWEKSNPSKELYTLLELIKVATILLHPFTPMASSKLASAFGFEIENPVNMEPGKTERYTITDAPILFRKIQVKQEG
ncbi:methionine--tRNA ligase [Desulfurococcus amylolyticus]|uniref:methionine--tRNA ligase n=1 Tax=Desulfurococcus amylolyticus TaxID=94694 RepID=UPI00064F781D|nr:methionine--tRNA ligase [Desulfurococcus amylolyticus]